MEKHIDLIEIIHNKFNKLSKGQKLIAKFIIENYDKAAFMTAASLGDSVGVSESTVVRFADTLGFDGYKELQKGLEEVVKNKLTTVQRISLSKDFTDYENVLKQVIKEDIDNIEKTIDEIDYKAFHKAVNIILNADNIYILGLRSSSFLAGYLGFYLKFLLDNVKIIQSGPNDVFEQLLKANNKDVIIGISYPRYSNRTLEAFDYGREKGCKIIGITDSLVSPTAEYADAMLIANSSMLSFVDSLVAPMSLINALIVSIGMTKEEDITSYFEDLEKIWEKYNIYNTNYISKI